MLHSDILIFGLPLPVIELSRDDELLAMVCHVEHGQVDQVDLIGSLDQEAMEVLAQLISLANNLTRTNEGQGAMLGQDHAGRDYSPRSQQPLFDRRYRQVG